jgi:anti-anti-sigma factor
MQEPLESRLPRGNPALFRMSGKRNFSMTLHPPLEVSVREAGGIHFIEVHGRLTIGEPSEMLNDFVQKLMQQGAQKLIVNLNDIPQIDSSGISVLVKLSISLARQGGALHLVSGQGRVRDALTVTRLVEAIPTYETEEQAKIGF